MADMMTPEGTASYQDVRKLIGETANRVLQYSIVHNILRDFDNEALNDELTDVPLFHGQKIYTVNNFRKKKIEMKNAEPCSIGLWKRVFNFSVGKNTWLLSYRCTQETRLRVLLWKILHNIYPTKFDTLLSKMEVRDNNNCSYCTDTVDVIDFYFYFIFLLNVRLYLNFGNS